MQRLDLPKALDDIRHKIQLIEARLELIKEGIELYLGLASTEQQPEQRFLYKELWMKKQEEQIMYTEQLHSQQVYLSEFELDLRKQQEMRKTQLAQIEEHLGNMLAAAKDAIEGQQASPQEKAVLKAICTKFTEQGMNSDDERISLFREMVNILQKLAKQ
ncbi:MAG: hypothetical protein SFW35_00780 [Chitinophagales bacterium]|nr:hypothetical protein [Chitinophagales bacterium]